MTADILSCLAGAQSLHELQEIVAGGHREVRRGVADNVGVLVWAFVEEPHGEATGLGIGVGVRDIRDAG